jgi:hypothetical protein
VRALHALQSAVNLLSDREKRTRLMCELAKIDPREEKQLAKRGLGWPPLRPNPGGEIYWADLNPVRCRSRLRLSGIPV